MAQTIDWIGIAEVGDYLEFLDTEDDGDTALYEVIEEPKVASIQSALYALSLFVRQELGDSKFNLQSDLQLFSVFKA